MNGPGRHAPTIWRSQNRFVANIGSLRQLQVFNDRGGIPVDFDIMRSVAPDIRIGGSQTASLSLWETGSASGFVTKPKVDVELLTIRFVTNGRIAYRYRGGDAEGSPAHATLIGFEDLREVNASPGFHAVGATFAVETLVAAHAALTGGGQGGLQPLAPVAAMTIPGMQALFCTLRRVQAQACEANRGDDLVVPLVREIMSYQLLSVWPKRDTPAPVQAEDVSGRNVRAALDYIEAHLSGPLMLADVAAAAGIGVRSLQDKFRLLVGRTPVQFIIDQRLRKVHRDLTSPGKAADSIADIATRWGFVHMSDFGQRYRRLYGCSPSDTRRDADRTR